LITNVNVGDGKSSLHDFTQIQSEKARRAEDEYIHWSFSKNQIAKIRMDFSEKLRFLAWRGNIPPVYVKAASRLHEYRNEMYHREEVRPEALRIVAHLYASIRADFLDLLKPRSFSGRVILKPLEPVFMNAWKKNRRLWQMAAMTLVSTYRP
jgi:hypothetical protein